MWVDDSGQSLRQRATHVVWADTRPFFGRAPEEDVYYAKVPPDGGDRDDH